LKRVDVFLFEEIGMLSSSPWGGKLLCDAAITSNFRQLMEEASFHH